MESIAEIVAKPELSRRDLIRLLSIISPDDHETLRAASIETAFMSLGKTVHFRGLIEFSNHCVNDCFYCGIRAGNQTVERYVLDANQIVAAARWAGEQGYGSVVLQSGERRDEQFITMVEQVISRITAETITDSMPQGIAITLSIGEQSAADYERFFKAGAHRYLLRIETSSPDLYQQIHPHSQNIQTRLQCLKDLKRIGYIVGTGVMIGLPGQTIENLADDILFFKEIGANMIGMGPFLPHQHCSIKTVSNTVTYTPQQAFDLSMLMIAATRLTMPQVNIAATTALQAVHHDGREQGLMHGANIIMPNITPRLVRAQYQLYDNKPCIDEDAAQCKGCLTKRLENIGRLVGWNQWGDPMTEQSKRTS